MTGHQYCSGRLGPEPTAPAPGLPAPRPGHWLRQPRPVEPGACAEPAQVPEAGCRWRPPPRPGPGSHGRGPREPEMGRWGSDQARRPRTHRRGRLREGRGGRSGGDGHGEGTRRRGAPSRTCRPPAPPRPSDGLRAESPGNRFMFYVGKDIRVSGGPSRPGSARGRPASRPAGGAASWPGQHGRGARAGPRPERGWEQGMCVSLRPGQPHCSPDHPASAPLPHRAVPRPSPAPRGKARGKVC